VDTVSTMSEEIKDMEKEFEEVFGNDKDEIQEVENDIDKIDTEMESDRGIMGHLKTDQKFAKFLNKNKTNYYKYKYTNSFEITEEGLKMGTPTFEENLETDDMFSKKLNDSNQDKNNDSNIKSKQKRKKIGNPKIEDMNMDKNYSTTEGVEKIYSIFSKKSNQSYQDENDASNYTSNHTGCLQEQEAGMEIDCPTSDKMENIDKKIGEKHNKSIKEANETSTNQTKYKDPLTNFLWPKIQKERKKNNNKSSPIKPDIFKSKQKYGKYNYTSKYKRCLDKQEAGMEIECPTPEEMEKIDNKIAKKHNLPVKKASKSSDILQSKQNNGKYNYASKYKKCLEKQETGMEIECPTPEEMEKIDNKIAKKHNPRVKKASKASMNQTKYKEPLDSFVWSKIQKGNKKKSPNKSSQVKTNIRK